MNYGTTLSEFVRKYRERNQYSQYDLARRLGYSPSYIGNLEQGRAGRYVAFYFRLRKLLSKTEALVLEEVLYNKLMGSE